MAATQQAAGNSLLALLSDPDGAKAKLDAWIVEQGAGAEVAAATLASAAQGVLMGYVLGSLSAFDPTSNPNAAAGAAAGSSPQVSAQLAALQKGGPWGQARNLGVMTGMNAGLSLAIKKLRGGKEDVWGSMGAAFGAGVAFSLVSGVPNPGQAALTTGAAFAGFNGLFYQIGKAFQGDPGKDLEYARASHMLQALGLGKYDGNIKKAGLSDATVMLWSEGALQEARIPPGPRLLILHHLDTYRNPGKAALKAALPLPMPPAPAPAQQAGWR